jgi:hypothetical protein
VGNSTSRSRSLPGPALSALTSVRLTTQPRRRVPWKRRRFVVPPVCTADRSRSSEEACPRATFHLGPPG